MKKLLSLLVALVLLAMTPAMAETVVETQTLTIPDGRYTIEVPADYFELNAEAVKTLFATEELQQLVAEMLGLQDASQLEMYFALMQQSNMMFVYTSDMIGNFNVQASEASLTMEMVIILKSMMDAAMVQQYVSMGLPEENIHPMDIQEIGGRSWYGVEAEWLGMQQLAMITVENGVQYTFSFTDIDAETCQSILASFTAVTAE